MMEIVEEISNLRLDVLDDAWVQGAFYAEFLEFGEIPSEYVEVLESIDVRRTFKNIMKAIDSALNDEDSHEAQSWAVLSQHVQHEKMLSFLAYYIDCGTKNVINKEDRDNALVASRLYYKLLYIPGYKAYNIYHSQLFAHSLACLGFPKVMCENEDNYYNTKELIREVNSVIQGLQPFVLDLRAIIDSLQLNPSDMNFEDILSNLVDVTGGSIVNKLNVDKIELANISRVIYEIIDILLCDANGEPNKEAIKLLFKGLLPKLVAASMDNRSANALVRASYVTYSGLLLTKYGIPALTGYTVLLEHICYAQEGLERAEVRTARLSLVIGLMSLLPKKSYREMVKWILKLSTTSKIAHRHIALEILASLLNNDPEEEKPVAAIKQRVQLKKTIKSEPAPEGTADGENNEQTANSDEKQSENISGEAVEGENTEAPGEGMDTQTETPPDVSAGPQDENSQRTQDTMTQSDHDVVDLTEEDVAGLLRQRAHTAPHAEILRAVYERVHDSSSTLRTRALHILAECLHADRASMRRDIQELNGDGEVSRLMAVAARGVCDERAVVRRAALALVHRSLATVPAPPQPNDFALLVGLCRDASILVRSAAITALGELVTSRPSDAAFDAFLTGPMHQLSDPETKVQEQVVTMLKHLVIDRLQKYSSFGTDDRLPWMFLDAVTRLNMRRHLQKACALLAKNTSCISVRLVDVLSTHLGADSETHDLHCLVLLTSAARHADCSDVGFVLRYYYKISEDEQSRDARLMPLTLELLTTWTRWTQQEERVALRDHLVCRLASPSDDGCRLACAALATHLDPHTVGWASELMQLAERRAVSCTDVNEWLRAADLSLVAPAPPSQALVRLFIGALTDPPLEWGESERGSCVAGVGRLSIRSREVAAAAAPPLAALLRDHAAPMAARINAILALTDICTRYTCIVEPLLECVCGCLSASSPPPLRRTAARALTRLLLAGYLRLRVPLYYRYCALLSDDDHDVREPAEYYVTCCLTPDAIYHHFVECVLHYNNNNDETNISFDARQLIYDVMLQRLSIVQKLNVQCRLAREVLGHAADVTDEGDGELPPALNAALLDTITLLCGPRMRLPRKPQRDGGADIEDLQERVTTNIVSHKMKCTVAEVLVPAVLRLYARLRTRGGQVAVYLVRIANDLLSDYRQEIEELIENDEELVEKVRQFQETIGLEPSFGNTRNLVTTSTTHEPETPRASSKRSYVRTPRTTAKKKALRI